MSKDKPVILLSVNKNHKRNAHILHTYEIACLTQKESDKVDKAIKRICVDMNNN